MTKQNKDGQLVILSTNPALKLLNASLVTGFLANYGNDHTRRSYNNSLRIFRGWIESLPAEHKSFNLLAEYKANLETKSKNGELSGFSIGLYIAVAKRYLGFLYEKGILEFNPATEVKGCKQGSTHYRRALDRNTEMPKLLNSIDRATEIGIRDYAIILILAHTGLRAFELAEANYGDLDSLNGRSILWIRTKGKLGKSEYVFITETPYEALVTYMELRKRLTPQSPLFAGTNGHSGSRMTTRGIRKRVDYWLKKAGLKTARVTTHSLRHTAAIAALKNGDDIRAVQGMLRHSDPSTTMVYLKDISRQDKPAEDNINYVQENQ
jgi:site-specific recombinase XerD